MDKNREVIKLGQSQMGGINTNHNNRSLEQHTNDNNITAIGIRYDLF